MLLRLLLLTLLTGRNRGCQSPQVPKRPTRLVRSPPILTSSRSGRCTTLLSIFPPPPLLPLLLPLLFPLSRPIISMIIMFMYIFMFIIMTTTSPFILRPSILRIRRTRTLGIRRDRRNGKRLGGILNHIFLLLKDQQVVLPLRPAR